MYRGESDLGPSKISGLGAEIGAIPRALTTPTDERFPNAREAVDSHPEVVGMA